VCTTLEGPASFCLPVIGESRKVTSLYHQHTRTGVLQGALRFSFCHLRQEYISFNSWAIISIVTVFTSGSFHFKIRSPWLGAYDAVEACLPSMLRPWVQSPVPSQQTRAQTQFLHGDKSLEGGVGSYSD
jgi:hypothetical protein